MVRTSSGSHGLCIYPLIQIWIYAAQSTTNDGLDQRIERDMDICRPKDHKRWSMPAKGPKTLVETIVCGPLGGIHIPFKTPLKANPTKAFASKRQRTRNFPAAHPFSFLPLFPRRPCPRCTAPRYPGIRDSSNTPFLRARQRHW